MSASLLPIKTRKRRAGVRQMHPHTAEQARRILALSEGSFAWWSKMCPPSYTSKGGRVRRWRELPEIVYGIVGTNADTLRVVPLVTEAEADCARARGSYTSMMALASFAVKTWTAPRRDKGREVEQAAAEWTPSPAGVVGRRPDFQKKGPAEPDMFGGGGGAGELQILKNKHD